MRYIHMGSDVSIFEEDIIGIFDLERTSIKKSVNDFLRNQQKKGLIYYCSLDMPKSFIITSNKTYITNVSTETIKKRTT